MNRAVPNIEDIGGSLLDEWEIVPVPVRRNLPVRDTKPVKGGSK